MNTEAQQQEIDYKEESDGSVVVDLTADDIEQEEGEEIRAAEGGQAETAEEDHDDDDDDHDEEVDPVRQARRARRKAKKEYIKRTNQEKDHRLQMLDRQNREMAEKIAILERKAHSADLAQIDRAIQEEQNNLRYAQVRMQEATENSDGRTAIAAQEEWYEARRKIEALQNLKNQAVQTKQTDGHIPDPNVVRYSNEWQDNNEWYDPNLRDEDSQIAKLIDTRMAQEGWNPATGEYWKEFDRRLQKRLPHRYTDSYEERPQRKPRSVVVGGGRETTTESGKIRIQIEPEKIRAMKEAGLWENPVTRKKMLERYAREQRKYTGS
jgi:hypothetical protein